MAKKQIKKDVGVTTETAEESVKKTEPSVVAPTAEKSETAETVEASEEVEKTEKTETAKNTESAETAATATEQASAEQAATAVADAAGKPEYHVTQRKQSILKNKKFFNFVIFPLGILVFTALRVVVVNVFISPNNFASGGTVGIGNMIEYATGGKFSTGWTTLILNVPLVILAFIFLNKGFAIKSSIGIVASSVATALLSDPMKKAGWVFDAGNNIGYRILAAVAAGVLAGVALAIMLKLGGSTGGSDIIAMFIQKKFAATNVSWFIYAIDAVVVLVSMFVFHEQPAEGENISKFAAMFTPVLLSLTQMFCNSMICDTISTGFKSAIKFEVITRDPEPLAREIIEKLGRGVTCVPVKGMYSHDDKYQLVCIIRKSQLADFNRILSHYPDTFAYISNTSEVMGNGFSR